MPRRNKRALDHAKPRYNDRPFANLERKLKAKQKSNNSSLPNSDSEKSAKTQ